MNPTTSDVAATGVQGRIDMAIRNAAARSGVDFSYLYHQARLESGFNPDARARTSSATGLYQFLDQSWLGVVERHGARHGMGWAANAIQRGANGRYSVADPQLRQRILDLRRNPEAAAAMAAEFASDNRRYLEGRLGRPMQAVDLYMGHFLGPAGAARFLRAHAERPDAAAASAFPSAARANRSIFYDRSGRARSFAEVRNMMAARLSVGGGNRTMMAAAVPPPAPAPAPVEDPTMRLAALDAGGAGSLASLSPRYARLAYLMLADLEGLA